MKNNSPLPNGVYTATLTPLKNDYSVDFDLLIDHCQWLLDQGTTGIALLGTTGEANSFSLAERKEILEKTIEGGIPADKLMVGTGCCALPESIELTKHATELGVGGVLVLPPFYYKVVSQKGIEIYFDQLIEGVDNENLRIYLYHFPKMSGVPFTHELIQTLLDKYPNQIVGIKDSSGDFENMKAMVEKFSQFQVFAGTEKYLLDILKAGGAGCISATANVTISLAKGVHTVWSANEQADNLQKHLVKVRTSFEGLPFSGALKTYIAHQTKNARWLTVRPPNESISSSELNSLKNKLTSLKFKL